MSLLVITAGQRAQILVDVVELRPMQSGWITFVDASAMQRAVEQTGRVALYGIQFRSDSAEIQPASRPTLEEIGRFLRANPTMNRVVAARMTAFGAGMAAPVASNDNEAGREQNRRVEAVKR